MPDWSAIAEALRRECVGGAFWGAQPRLPAGRDRLLVPDTAAQARSLQDMEAANGQAHRCCLIGPYAGRHGIPVISNQTDPWHLVSQASRITADPGGEWFTIGRLSGVPTHAASGENGNPTGDLAAVVRNAIAGWAFLDPFTERPIDCRDLIGILAEWRRMIDANRRITAVYGIAPWKRVTTRALLWDGGAGPRHATATSAQTAALGPGDRVIAWTSRSPAGLVDRLGARGVAVGEIEDGFIRSTGLGANCVPPLSIIVDFAGIYFDPSQPSDLEQILAEAEMSPELLARAAALRARLVAAGISKYGAASAPVVIAAPGRRRVLVPGQVADDRSVRSGGGGLGNLDLLRRARECEPGAWLIYKPHPDVEAGHRAGHIPEDQVRQLADEIDRTSPIAPLIDSVDAVHTLTSLAGFEALMRGKAVTTHGVPFYAGWGLTRDLGQVPPRRARNRTLDELVAATLILYARYLDPVSRLPCPPEILIERLESGDAKVSSPLVTLRELQGRVSKLLRRFEGRS